MRLLPLVTAFALGPPAQPETAPKSIPVRFYPQGETQITLEGVLHVPAGAGPGAPGMVFCHPDPRMGGTMDSIVVRACVRALLVRGIAVLRFNFRGVEGSTGHFDGGVGEVSDVLGALDHLDDRAEIDPDRLFVGGYSFGAAMALKAASKRQQLLGYAGVALPFMGDQEQQDEFRFIADLACPLLVVIGETDEYGSSEAIDRFFKEQQVKGEVVVVPETDHFFATPPEALDRAAGALADFVKRQASPISEE
jgi:alpha/beta superfamily hydrolase